MPTSSGEQLHQQRRTMLIISSPLMTMLQRYSNSLLLSTMGLPMGPVSLYELLLY